jgi:hypothetical protein
MIDRDTPVPLHPAASPDLEAQWLEAARSLGLDVTAEPVLEPQVKLKTRHISLAILFLAC